MGAQPMPEQMGIGQLPAQNMQQMADGGIAGYEGYDEGGMAYGQEPVMMMAEGGVARYQAGGSIFDQMDQQKAGQIAQLNEKLAIIEPQLRAAAASGDPQAIQMYAQEAQAVRNQINTVREGAGNRVGVIDKLATQTPAAPSDTPTGSGMDRRMQAGSMPNVPSITPPAKPAAPKADTGRKVSGIGAPAARPAAPEPSAAARYAATQKAMGVDGGQGLDTAQKELSSALMEAAESNEREVEKGIAARGKAGEGREARLNKREAGMGAQKNELQGLALLEAGLAIMSTPGKLAEAVGKGAQAGLKTYSAGVKDLRAAQEKLDEARDQLEELRRNEDNMTAKERREARQGVKAAQVKGKELGLQAAEKMYGYKRADASAIFTVESQGVLTDKEIQGRKDVAAMQERGANARAARTPAEIQMVERIMAEKKIPFSEALNYMTAAKREPVSQEKLRADWLDPTKRMQIAQDYPNVKTFDDYALVMGAGTGGGAGGFKLVGVR
jgi:hypothetical protein